MLPFKFTFSLSGIAPFQDTPIYTLSVFSVGSVVVEKYLLR
jgi:hypothetical protein